MGLMKDKFIVFVMAEGNYVANTYDNSLRGSPNPANSYLGGVEISYSYKAVSLSYSYHSGVRRFTDGTGLGFSGNSIKLAAKFYKTWSAELSTSNLNFVDDPFVDPWFFNPFSRVLNLNIGVTF